MIEGFLVAAATKNRAGRKGGRHAVTIRIFSPKKEKSAFSELRRKALVKDVAACGRGAILDER